MGGDGPPRGLRMVVLWGYGRHPRRVDQPYLAALSRQSARSEPVAARIWSTRTKRAMTRKQRRLAVLLVSLGLLGSATAMMLAAFSDKLVFFYSPSELAA